MTLVKVTLPGIATVTLEPVLTRVVSNRLPARFAAPAPLIANVPPDSATTALMLVLPAPPGLIFRLSRSPPATLSVMAPLMTTLRLALSVRVLVPTPL